jgi:hypothetical protein
MANIAQAIQQGTAQQAEGAANVQAGIQRGEQAQRQQIADTMAVKSFQNQQQALIDQKAKGWMDTFGAIENNIALAKGKLEKATTDSERLTARGELELNIGRRNELVTSTMASPRMVALLKKSTYSNEELRDLIFSDDNWNYLSPDEQNQVARQAASYQVLERQMQAERAAAALQATEAEAFVKERGKRKAALEVPIDTTAAKPPRAPTTKFFEHKEGAALPGGVKWKEKDFTRYFGGMAELGEAFVKMEPAEKQAVNDILSAWTPSEDKKTQKGEAEDFLATVERLPLPEAGPYKAFVRGLKLLAEDNASPEEIGFYIDKVKEFTRTKQPVSAPGI